MRPQVIVTILVIAELLLVLVAFSPSVGFRLSTTVAVTEWQQHPNPETETAMRRELGWDKLRPRVIWALAAANAFLIVYAATRCKRPV